MEHENATKIEPISSQNSCGPDAVPSGSPVPGKSNGTRSRKKNRREANRQLRTEIAELREQLREKESLVQALTKRLEQAAEQLDRIRRTGGDRGLHLTGGLPVELVESQKTLIEKLEHAIEQWEDLQAAASLGRLEVQIADLRDLIAARVSETGSAGVPPTPGADSPAASSDSEAPETNSWEAMKAQLLAGAENVSAESAAASQAGSDASPNETASEDQTSQPSVQETAADESTASETTHVPEIPAPEPIELDKADLEQLREAIEARDAYISYLLKKLKVAPTIAPPVDWEALQNTPDELKQKLQELQEQLTEKLRLAEVDLSLERARLAREEAALRLREEQLEQRLKQYGFEEADSADGENDSKRRRRWLKFLSRSEDRSQTGDSP